MLGGDFFQPFHNSIAFRSIVEILDQIVQSSIQNAGVISKRGDRFAGSREHREKSGVIKKILYLRLIVDQLL